LLALAMCLKLARSGRDFALRAGLGAALALLLANAGYYMWWGGAAAAPRHLIPALGVLGFGAAAFLSNRRLRWLFLPVAALSMLNMLVIAGVGLEAPEHGDVLFDFAYRRLWQGKLAALSGASNFGLGLGMPRAATLGPPLVWLVLGGHWLWRMVEPPRQLAEKTA
jgi:hypothetical protein